MEPGLTRGVARFGSFELDLEARQLSREGGLLPLTPKAFELLAYLVERAPRALSKAQIHDRIWPTTHVAAVNLHALVNELRRALGDDARAPRFIRTVRGFGYAFCAALETDAPREAAREGGVEYRLFWRDREFALGAGENTLGRTHEADAWIEDASVSRRHAVIRVDARGARLEDCDSKNGTFLRDERLGPPVDLVDGDEIRLGKVRLLFRALARDATVTETSD